MKWLDQAVCAGILAFLPHLVAEAALAQPQSPHPEDERTMGVGVVVTSRLTGLNTLPLDAQTRLRSDAKSYVHFRKNRSSEGSRDLATQRWKSWCLGDDASPVFCRAKDWDDPSSVAQSGKRKKKRPPQEEIATASAALAQGDFAAFEDLSDGAISKAFQKTVSKSQFDALEKSLLAQKSCEAGRLALLMGQKLEDFLPDGAAMESVVRIYEKAGACEETSEPSERSRYRAALLLVSREKWSQAIPHLEKLGQNRKSDYYSRAIYWRARAERSRGDHLTFKQLAARLTKEFPIHYHSLLLAPKVLFNAAQNLSLPEPEIHFESRKVGKEWNDRIRGIEVLQEIGASDYTRDLFAELDDLLDGAEPEARLYLAVLQQRNNNSIGTFKVLSSLFRDAPSMLSRQTLALFFPFSKSSEQALKVAQGGGLDPYLIAALIRQESGFVTHARSPAGALGLMQLMPATARTMERVSKRELLDGRTNVRLGVKFFRRLVARFGGKVDHALAAYNAGPLRVDEWQRRYPVTDPVLFVDLIPFKETREYVSLISRNYYWYLQIYARHLFDERIDGPSGRALASANSQPVRTGNNSPLEFSLFSSH